MSVSDTGEYSDITSFEPVALDDLQNPVVRQAVAYWRSLCGNRRFPSRDELDPRELAPLRPHMILLRVIDDGADFEYRFMGAVQAKAYTFPVEGRRMKEMAAKSPHYGGPVFAGYQYIQQNGIAFALRGWAGRDYVAANFAYFESVTLPLGSDDKVDHLAVFSAYAPRGLQPTAR
jgi:hypothetical protein